MILFYSYIQFYKQEFEQGSIILKEAVTLRKNTPSSISSSQLSIQTSDFESANMLKCAIDASQAKTNYLDDAVTHSRCIVEMPLTERVLDKTCSATEPAPFLESITGIPANGNFFYIRPDDLITEPMYQTLFPQSESDYDYWEDSIDLTRVSSVPLSTVSSCDIFPTSDDSFADPIPHYLSEIRVASNNHDNGPPAFSSYVAANEISNASEKSVDFFDESPSLVATSKCINVRIIIFHLIMYLIFYQLKILYTNSVSAELRLTSSLEFNIVVQLKD